MTRDNLGIGEPQADEPERAAELKRGADRPTPSTTDPRTWVCDPSVVRWLVRTCRRWIGRVEVEHPRWQSVFDKHRKFREWESQRVGKASNHIQPGPRPPSFQLIDVWR